MRISPGERLLVAYARRFPLRRGKLRLVNALWRAVSGKSGPWRLAKLAHGGFEMECDLREMLQRQFYFFGTYFLEDELLRCWTQAAQGSHTVFDVGANAGIYSLAALAANPNAVVHAFEPTPEIAASLCATAQRNGLYRLHVHELAVFRADADAVLTRFRGETGDNEGMNYIRTGVGDATLERVRTARLDTFCAEHGISRLDLVKIDIQGHEPAALEGAGRMLAEGRIGTVFMELNWSPGSAHAPAQEAIDLLARSGYRFSRPGRQLEWRGAGEWMRDLSDIVARHPRFDQGVET